MRRIAPELLLLLCASTAFSQPTPQSASPQTTAPQNQPEVVSHQVPATFSSRVNLVSVPVVVRDRDGRAVGSLRQEDFQLFDKGRSQEITKFTIETGSSAVVAPSPSAVPAVEPVAPGTAPKPALPGRFVAYFFDDVHVKTGDLLQARQSANRHLDNAFDSNTRAGVFTTSGRVTQDFTSDLEKLHAAVNKIQPWTPNSDKQTDCPPVTYYVADVLMNQEHVVSPAYSDQQIMAAIPTDRLLQAVVQEAEACMCTLTSAECAQILIPAVKTAIQRAVNYGMTDTRTALLTTLDLIRSMSVLPGSRTIVMVSPGFIMSGEHRFDENDIFDKAIRANVTINTLDIRGLYTGALSADDQGHAVAASGVLTQADQDEATQDANVLAEFAAATGGTFFHNSNALEDGLKRLAARPEYLYILGFSPDSLKLDGSYHRLKVTIKDGSKTIEARRGYWAPNHTTDPARQAREDIEEAVFSRDEMLDIPVKLHTEFFKQSEAKAELTVESRVDLKSLKFKKADERNRDNLVVVTGLFDDNGRYVKGTERTIEMQLRDQTLESARATGLVVKESFDIPPGRYVVRVVVHDSEGQSMAAQNSGVEIP